MNNPLNLYEHNRESYEKINEAFSSGEKVVGIVHATGTGKSYNALQLALDNPDKKITIIAPHNSILEHIEEIIKESGLSFERDFPNLTLMNYQSLVNLSRNELATLSIDILVLDEFHHIGAPVWGERVNELIKTHPDLEILGMSAYTIRDRGTVYERDMANPDGGELFSSKIVSRYDIPDAMLDGVLPIVVYRSAYIKLMGTLEALEEKVENKKCSKEEKELYDKLLKDAKRKIEKVLSLPDMIEKYVGQEDKLIYFCPPGSNIEEIEEEAKKWFLRYIPESDIIFYKTTSAMGELGKKNRDAFYHDKTLDGLDATHKLRVMFCINQYNEGVHAPNVNGVIMGRETKSDIVFFEQLGRALSVRGDIKAQFLAYQKYSREELLQLCQSKNIMVYEDMTNERMIEKLIAPYVIDLTNNIGFIKELENNLQNKVKERQEKGDGKRRILNIEDVSFDIEIVNEEIYEILKYVSDRLTMTWEDWYELAKAYFDYHGNLDILRYFKTMNGYLYDENGLNLGSWLHTQRIVKRKGMLSQDREEKLLKIGMVFDVREMQWGNMYNLAKKYYEHHGNLNVPANFKTINGHLYDNDGFNLGTWIVTQKMFNKKGTLSRDKKEKLLAIGIIFDGLEAQWEKMYALAEKYYEYHKNLNISINFKTKNGYLYNEAGFPLGRFISKQRTLKKNGILKKDREEKLLKIGMVFNAHDVRWDEMYTLAKKYYEHHGNLKINPNFRTKNGYEYDETGFNLGAWINTQRIAQQSEKLNKEREEKLFAIGMIFNVHEEQWEKMYALAKKYYEYYGNLDIPQNFKTMNGYLYDETGFALGVWINNQRITQQNEKLNKDREEKLLKIGMVFDVREMQWEKMYALAKKYYEYYGNLNVSDKFKTVNGYEYDEKGVTLGKWISKQRIAKKQDTLNKEREEKLFAIGMIFNVHEEQWEKMYALAEKYYEHYGNLKIPFNFKTINGYEHDEEGVSLGIWLSKQRAFQKKRMLNKDYEEKLLAIGMIFDVLEARWNEMYVLAKKYYEYYGNLKIPFNFKTINGYEHDEEGVSLGIWLSKQRTLQKKKMLNKDCEEKLLAIGMVFDTKKNTSFIQAVCQNYGINEKKNKSILKGIPYREMVAKIRFLEERQIPIVNNGLLHEIFNISNISLQEKYGIRLEELVNTYSLEEKRGR